MKTEEQQQLEKKALEQFMSGESLFSKDSAFALMLKSFIEKLLNQKWIHILMNKSAKAVLNQTW